MVLCERLASIFLHWATVRNLAGPRDMTQQLAADPEVGKRQLFTGQPRTKTLLQAVSEFGHYTTVVIPLNSDSLTSMLSSLPKGAKATSRIVQRGVSRYALRSTFGKQVLIHQELRRGQDFELITVGSAKGPHRVYEGSTKGWPS